MDHHLHISLLSITVGLGVRMGTVGFEVLVLINHENRQEFFQSYRMLRKPGQQSPDCESEGLFEDTHKPNRFLWVERWKDAKALEQYMASDNFRMIMGAIDVLGSLQELRPISYD